jgi:hypothetical protein
MYLISRLQNVAIQFDDRIETERSQDWSGSRPTTPDPGRRSPASPVRRDPREFQEKQEKQRGVEAGAYTRPPFSST